jgi:uncharacterized membrane protein
MFAIIVETNLDRKTKFWIMLMKIGAYTGCHQLHERSFSFGDYQFPVCARCTGLFFGQIIGIITGILFININLKLLLFALISLFLLGIDGLGQLKKLWVSTNVRRLATGFSCGFFIMIFHINIINLIIKKLFT